MAKLPAVSGPEAVTAFETAGFSVVRIKGSHHIMARPGHPNNLSVPVHGNRSVPSGTLRALIRGAGLSVDEFVALLD